MIFSFFVNCSCSPLSMHREPFRVALPVVQTETHPACGFFAVKWIKALTVGNIWNLTGTWTGSYVVVLGIYYKLQIFLYLPASGIVQGMRSGSVNI